MPVKNPGKAAFQALCRFFCVFCRKLYVKKQRKRFPASAAFCVHGYPITVFGFLQYGSVNFYKGVQRAWAEKEPGDKPPGSWTDVDAPRL